MARQPNTARKITAVSPGSGVTPRQPELRIDDGIWLDLDNSGSLVFPQTRITLLIQNDEHTRQSAERFMTRCLVRDIGRYKESPIKTAIAHTPFYLLRFSHHALAVHPHLSFTLTGIYREISENFFTGVSYKRYLLKEDSHRSFEDEAISQIKQTLLKSDKSLSNPFLVEDNIYRSRLFREELPTEFLKRVYGEQISAGSISMSAIKELDVSLYHALRNYARTRKVAIETILPKGRDNRGAKFKDAGIDPSSLDPSDPRDEALLAAMRRRKLARERMQRVRKKPTHS